MNIKHIFLTLILSLLFFNGVTYAKIYEEAAIITEPINKDIANVNENIDLDNTKISLFSTNTIDIEVRNIYVDDNNNLTAMLFKNNGAFPENLYVNINGIDYNITETPDSNNNLYKYFEGENIIYGDISVQFKTPNEESEITTISPTKIVTFDEGNWITSDDGHSLYLYNGSATDLIVPNFYNGQIITSVGGYVENGSYENILFSNTNLNSFNSVAISEGIQIVYHFAFYGMSHITGINLANSIKSIGVGAFAYCNGVNSELVLPNSLSYLGEYAFMYSTITGSLTIPSRLKVIGRAAFYNCPKLTEAVLQEGVEEIGEMAFAGSGYNVVGLTSIELPSTLKKIGPFALQFCDKIKYIELPEGLEVISDGVFNHMQGLENTSLVIPSTVKLIGGDYNVTENTGYGCHIFYDMGKDESFTAFEVAEGNEYFTAVDGVLYSKDMTRMLAYPRGKRDTVFEIPEGITQIDEMAFSRASYLKKLILPDSYILSDTVPANVLNQLANNLAVALYVYSSVDEIGVKETNPNYTTVDGILYSKDMKSLWYIPNKYIGAVDIPEGVERIEKCATFIAGKSNTNWSCINIPSSMWDINDIVMEVFNDSEHFLGYVNIADSIYYQLNTETKVVEAISHTPGDVNMSGDINKIDAGLILKYISGINIDNIDKSFNKRAAEYNGDDLTDIIDVIDILGL